MLSGRHGDKHMQFLIESKSAQNDVLGGFSAAYYRRNFTLQCLMVTGLSEGSTTSCWATPAAP
jgi:hypothetical protein